MENVLAWMLFGLIAGSIANAVDPYPSRSGFLGSIVLGIAGALVGGFIASTFFGVGVTGFDFTSFGVAIAGALLLLYGSRAFTRKTV